MKTLKIRVKLILNCSRAHAITYTNFGKVVKGVKSEYTFRNHIEKGYNFIDLSKS